MAFWSKKRISSEEPYIGRKEYFSCLDNHAKSDSPPLVISGEAGAGKSALATHWLAHYKMTHPNDFVFSHFIGGTPRDADYANILYRLVDEIKKRYGLTDEFPPTVEKLREAFPNWLAAAAARERLIIVIDGIDQLEDIENAPDLKWLPESIPPDARLVVASGPGKSLDILEKRGWQGLKIEPLSQAETSKLVADQSEYLQVKLNKKQRNRIASADQCANPLFVHTLLGQLWMFEEQKRLDEGIDYLIAAKNLDDIFERILKYLEENYEKERPGLIGQTLALLWGAGIGLLEDEIIDILGVPADLWKPAYLALAELLVSRSGRLNFFHEYFRGVAQNRYLSTKKTRKQVHMHLAKYFGGKEIGPLKIDELPWQYAKAGEWRRLTILLVNEAFFTAAWSTDAFDVKRMWDRIEINSDYSLVDAYKEVIASPATFDGDYVRALASLLNDADRLEEAQLLKNGLQANLADKATTLKAQGRQDEAMDLWKEAEQVCRESENKEGLQRALGNQALILKAWGNFDEAIALLTEAEQVCRELGNMQALAAVLGNHAIIMQLSGKPDEAMKLHKEEERICRESENKDGLRRSLGNQALIYKAWGKPAEALPLYEERGRVCRELGNKQGLMGALGSQALILQDMGKLDEAMKLYKAAGRVSVELNNKDGISIALGNQAIILKEQGKLDKAMELHKQEERICREIGNDEGLQNSLGNQALIVQEQGQLDEAMELLKDQERICRQTGNNNALAYSLINQASLLANKIGLAADALPLANEAYDLAVDVGQPKLAAQIKAIREKIKKKAARR